MAVPYTNDIFLSRFGEIYCDIRYNRNMNTVYLSREAHPLLHAYLKRLGYRCVIVEKSQFLPSGISSHPDLFMCKLGCRPDSPVYLGEREVPKSPYPHDVGYNAACTGKYFIHNLAATDYGLRQTADEMGLILVDVKQGYTKCNIVVLDDTSLITSDGGIQKELSQYGDLDCLLIEPGHVALPGFESGFVGGSCGRVGNQIIFHGALRAHPNFLSIRYFIESKGLRPVWFDEFPLTDIGSIIEAPEYEVSK